MTNLKDLEKQQKPIIEESYRDLLERIKVAYKEAIKLEGQRGHLTHPLHF